MDKRTFIKTSSVIMAAGALSPLVSCKGETSNGTKSEDGSFELPALPFAFDALVPNIDALTMEIHHGKHHAGYVNKLNAALPGSRFEGLSLEAICVGVGEGDTSIRNNGGGHFNHSLFWQSMAPGGGGNPSGNLSDAINAAFGSFESFKKVFSDAAAGRFGSGWAWLCQNESGGLFVCSTPNQDNPLMSQLVGDPGKPLLGLDVWEHAYYLNYQNRRGDYIANFFNVVDWSAVEDRMA